MGISPGAGGGALVIQREATETPRCAWSVKTILHLIYHRVYTTLTILSHCLLQTGILSALASGNGIPHIFCSQSKEMYYQP